MTGIPTIPDRWAGSADLNIQVFLLGYLAFIDHLTNNAVVARLFWFVVRDQVALAPPPMGEIVALQSIDELACLIYFGIEMLWWECQ